MHERLLEHWRDALRLPLLVVKYEQLVEDTQASTETLLRFCELPWLRKDIVGWALQPLARLMTGPSPSGANACRLRSASRSAVAGSPLCWCTAPQQAWAAGISSSFNFGAVSWSQSVQFQEGVVKDFPILPDTLDVVVNASLVPFGEEYIEILEHGFSQD